VAPSGLPRRVVPRLPPSLFPPSRDPLPLPPFPTRRSSDLFRADRHSNLHFIIGKASFSEVQLAENYAAALDEVLRLKPASSKGRYIKKIALSTTMGPGIQVDSNRVKDVAVEDEAQA